MYDVQEFAAVVTAAKLMRSQITLAGFLSMFSDSSDRDELLKDYLSDARLIKEIYVGDGWNSEYSWTWS